MENSDWAQIHGNSSAPYINSLLTNPHASYCTQYFNPSNLHPSEPNYVWLEGATNTFSDMTFTQDDSQITSATTTSGQHLATLMTAANVTWREYAEGVDGTSCPLADNPGINFIVRHVPYVFFQDVVGNPPSATNPTCIQHIRPYTELQGDLQNDKVAQYNFITPNGIDDGHDSDVPTQDAWLAKQVPTIMSSKAYTDGGVIFITWDECDCPQSDVPIGMIAISPFAKGNSTSTKMYDHSSLVRTTEEIFGLTPMLNNAATATDLSDLFSTFP
jgi:phospholipase C